MNSKFKAIFIFASIFVIQAQGHAANQNDQVIERSVAPIFQKIVKKLTESDVFDHFTFDEDRLVAVIKTGGQGIRIQSNYFNFGWFRQTQLASTPETISLLLPTATDIGSGSADTKYTFASSYQEAVRKNGTVFEVYPSPGWEPTQLWFGFTKAKFTDSTERYLEVLVYGVLSAEGNSFDKKTAVGFVRRNCFGPDGHSSGCFEMDLQPYDWNSRKSSLKSLF